MDWEEIILDTAIIVAIIAATASVLTAILGLLAKKKDTDSFTANTSEHEQLEKGHERLSEDHRELLRRTVELASLTAECGFEMKSTQEKVLETKNKINQLWEVNLEEKNRRQKAFACLTENQIATEQQLAMAAQKIIDESRAEHIRSNELQQQLTDCQEKCEALEERINQLIQDRKHWQQVFSEQSQQLEAMKTMNQKLTLDLERYRNPPRSRPMGPVR